MMQISHAATGAAVGKFAPNPLIAFLLGILIHFLIDKIPHYWPESKKGKTIFVVLDHSVTYIIFLAAIYFKVGTTTMIAGAAGSILVDIVIIGIPPIYKGMIGKWHTNRQPHHTEPLFLLTDAAVTLLGVLILIYL